MTKPAKFECVRWRDLVALTPKEKVWELSLSLPWFLLSLWFYERNLYWPGLACSFYVFLTGLRQSHNAQHYSLGLARVAQDGVLFGLSMMMVASMHAVQVTHLHHHRHCLEDEDNCRYHARNRREILDSRVDSTRVIGEAIRRCAKPPSVWLNASTATIYKHTYGEAWDENGVIVATPEAKDEFSIEVATAWERELDEAHTPATRKIAMRMAMVLGAGKNSVFPVLRRLARVGLGGRMGSGRQFVSWIHEIDYCRAVEWLITHDELSGGINLASPNPLPNDEMMRVLRKACGTRFGLPAANWMLEVGAFFLRTETELLIKSRRVIPRRLIDSGFEFRFPAIRGVFDNLLMVEG
jgi:uncharacterized protein (TIGR01777 family)